MAPPLLTLKDIHLTFGGTPLLTGAELTVAPGDRICLVGRNGSGKSTLLKIAAGLVEPDSGERFVHPSAVIRYLPQDAQFGSAKTVLDFVVSGLKPTDDPHHAMMAIQALGLTGDEDPARLSGGEARRAALAHALAPNPDVLLLDEPTNHLDLPAIEWLEGELKSIKSAFVLISHDRRFLENLSRTTVWIDRGKSRHLDQGFSGFEAWRDATLEEEEADQHKLDRKIARENEWMHGGVTGRRKRNVRRVAELRAMREARLTHRKAQGNVKLEVSEGQLSGRLVIEAKGISKSYGVDTIVADFSTRILRGDRVGFVGPNGAGKTTLIKMLTGELQPDLGMVRLGANLETVVLDQKREDLNPEWTVAEALTGGRGDQVIVNGKGKHVTSYMRDFLFQPEQRGSPVSVLSGGEKARLMLARALAKPSNLLVLDEPTNDLDLETLDLLQEMLADYPGTLLLVSHDRDFLDRVVGSVIVPEGGGQWLEYAGGYTDMLAQRRLQAKEAAAERREEAGQQPGKPGRKSGGASGGQANAGGAPGAGAEKARKLSFKDKHALETLPATLEKLQGEITQLGQQLADPQLYVRSPDKFEAATARLTAAQAELAAAEEQWLELEMKREEIEG